MINPLLATSGTLINMATVTCGTLLGLVVGRRLPQRFQDTIFQGLGLATILLGVLDGQQTHNPLYVLAGILFGGLIGAWLDIDSALVRLGDSLQRRFAAEGSRVSEAFVTTSLIFCIGPLTILGSIQNGLTGDNQSLVFKATLDGFAAFAFSAALGWGVLLSVATIALFQGGLSLCAGLISPIVDRLMIAEMSATGGLIILAIGMRLLKIAELRIGNFLPALFVAPAAVKVVELLHPCIGSSCGAG
jgi:uncharacterized membrane protein YqgA involved in biofilm formation